MAASIIRDEIRLSVHDLTRYPEMDEVENSNMIPDSLRRFLKQVLDPKGKNTDVVNRRRTATAHSWISACRPRSFVSPLLLAISVYIHRKYASRELIDILSSLSFSDDYKEVQLFESPHILWWTFLQLEWFHTVCVWQCRCECRYTITGHNTFHGIACVTPEGTVETLPLQRTVKLPQAELVEAFGQVRIRTYAKPTVPGLKSVSVEPLMFLRSQHLQITAFDTVWMIGYLFKLTPRLPWSGFMKMAMKDDDLHTSRIESLPLINLDPSNPSTIYTAMCFAQEQIEKHGLKVSPE